MRRDDRGRRGTNPFIDLGLRVRFRGGSGGVNDGREFIVVPESNLVRLVRFIGHGNTMGGPAARLVYYAGENIRSTSIGGRQSDERDKWRRM